MGYDRPLDYVFCTVWRAGEIAYSNLDDAEARTSQQNVEYFRPVLERLGVTVPDEMFPAVAEDQRRREGNKVVRYGPATFCGFWPLRCSSISAIASAGISVRINA